MERRSVGAIMAQYRRDTARERRETSLYIHGDGRITCGALRCAGMTAYYSKMREDMNGARIEKVTQAHAIGFATLDLTLACESCGQAYEGGK